MGLHGACLRDTWQADCEMRGMHRLDELKPVCLWVLKAGLEKDEATLPVVLVGFANGCTELVASLASNRSRRPPGRRYCATSSSAGSDVRDLLSGTGTSASGRGFAAFVPRSTSSIAGITGCSACDAGASRLTS